MPHFMIELIPYINLLILSLIIKCLFLRNIEPLRPFSLITCLHEYQKTPFDLVTVTPFDLFFVTVNFEHFIPQMGGGVLFSSCLSVPISVHPSCFAFYFLSC